MRKGLGMGVGLFVAAVLAGGCGGGGGGGGGGGTPLAAVSGTILDSANLPVSGATVTIASTPVSTVTDANGVFSMEVEPGAHTLTAVKGGYTIYFDGSLDVPSEPSSLDSLLPTSPYYATPVTWYADADGDGYGDVHSPSGPSSFPAGNAVFDSADCDDAAAAVNPETVWYADGDGDGYSDGTTRTQCAQPAGYALASSLSGTSGDCDDADAALNPATVWYADGDGDGYSDGTNIVQCAGTAGYALSADLTALTGDCDDSKAALNPDTVWYRDADNDGYSNGTTATQCLQPTGHKLLSALIAATGDCDDDDATQYPGVTWYADLDGDGYTGGDNLTQCLRPTDYRRSEELTSQELDCDDADAALNPATVWYKDADGDLYSDGTSLVQCVQPLDYALLSALYGTIDCDDTDPLITFSSFYRDADSDSYGDAASSPLAACASPGAPFYAPESLLSPDTDCDDADPSIHPDAVEACDGVDANCDGVQDVCIQADHLRGSPGISAAGFYAIEGSGGADDTPGGRFAPAAWADTTGCLTLFGGYGHGTYGTPGSLSDLWSFDGTNWTFVEGPEAAGSHAGVYGTLGVPNAANRPGSRARSGTVVDPSGNRWLFGGTGNDATGASGYLNDLWVFDGSAWTWVSGASARNAPAHYGTAGVANGANVPGARTQFVMWMEGGTIWVFGGDSYFGSGVSGRANDLWNFDTGTSQWTWVAGPSARNQRGNYGTMGVAAATNVPGARTRSSGWLSPSGDLWIFGGYGYDATGVNPGRLNDLWRFDTAAGWWSWEGGSDAVNIAGVYGNIGGSDSSSWPGGRDGAMAAKTPSGFYLFGGNGYDSVGGLGYLNDLWWFNGNVWTWMGGSDRVAQAGQYSNPGAAPGGRYLGVLRPDGSGGLYLFSGQGYGDDIGAGTGALNDLWRITPLAP